MDTPVPGVEDGTCYNQGCEMKRNILPATSSQSTPKIWRAKRVPRESQEDCTILGFEDVGGGQGHA